MANWSKENNHILGGIFLFNKKEKGNSKSKLNWNPSVAWMLEILTIIFPYWIPIVIMRGVKFQIM